MELIQDIKYCYKYRRLTRKNLTEREWNHLLVLEYADTQGYTLDIIDASKEYDALLEKKYAQKTRVMRKMRLLAEDIYYGTKSFTYMQYRRLIT